MDLFILRHGKAGQSSDMQHDSDRTLTGDGKDEIKKVARWMKSKKYRFDGIATSPLKRAHETAVIVTRVLGEEDGLTIWDELAPGGNPDKVFYRVSQYGEGATVLIVGHEPALSMLISRIISGDENATVALSKGGLAKIRNCSFKKQPSGELQWLLTPKQIVDIR
jgi:phosphohistidine phosphatase